MILVWELDIEYLDGVVKVRVVSVVSDGEIFMVLWDDGVWVLYDVSDGFFKYKLRFDGFDVYCDEVIFGKWSKKSEDILLLVSVVFLCFF